MDIVDEINRAHRELLDGERKVVTLRRSYNAGIEDVWDACTDADRLKRWFLPVSGDLRLGGSYQFDGQAGGKILRCEPPRLLKVSWLFGENPLFSEVTVRLSSEDGGTLLELRHTADVPPDMWSGYGPGAVGVGWDLGLLGLALHLTGAPKVEESTFHLTEDGRRCIITSSQAWGRAYTAAGGAPDQVATAVANTTAFYAPEEESS